MAYVTVTGTITKFHNSGTGFQLAESYSYNGQDYTKKWEVFPATDTHGAKPGDNVTINGTLSTSVYSYVTDSGQAGNSVSLKVNAATIKATQQNESAPF